MFTGIIQTQGVVTARSTGRLLIRPQRPFKKVSVGESIAVDGACLTVDQVVPKVPGIGARHYFGKSAWHHFRVPGTVQRLAFRLLPETVRATTLGRLRVGDRVNLERSLRVGDRLGGHWLLGHVDGKGTITGRRRSGRFLTLGVRVPSHLAGLVVPKGPIAVDGVSLTLDSKRDAARIKVHLIPHTAEVTTLGQKRVGDPVNLEVDLIAKYLWGML